MGRNLLSWAAMIALMSVMVPTASAGSLKILDGSVAVQAAKWVRYPVIVTDGMLNPRIVGRLRASGGTGNDIVVAVMGDADFTNWANGHGGGAIYHSGQVTVAEVSARLSEPGVYIVLLNNGFSSLTPKTVEGTLRLVWDDPPPLTQASSAAADKGGRAQPPFQVLVIALCGVLVGSVATVMILSQRKQLPPQQ
jgi:hypothetical protein